jgi:hypothetical protein
VPNDAKLGFLVGVAGVIVAGVVFFQGSPRSSPPAAAETSAAASPPAPAATPMPKGKAGSPPAIGGTREELQGRPTSRSANGE